MPSRLNQYKIVILHHVPEHGRYLLLGITNIKFLQVKFSRHAFRQVDKLQLDNVAKLEH